MKILQRMVAALLLVVLSPFLLLIAVAVKISSSGPVLFIGQRLGRDEVPFLMYKFRTMYEGSEQLGDQTVPNDSRVTPLGRILRPYHADEWPQLWNVLTGEMGLVGPRPQVPSYYAEYRNSARYRQCMSVLPGITGIAQVRGQWWVMKVGRRRQLAVEAFYARRKCFWFDIRLIALTTRVIAAGKSI